MKILIVGTGKLGRYLASTLVHENYDVTVIDKNESVLERLNNSLDIYTVNGNGLVVDTLLDADIKDTDIIISCMKNDEDNILCSLLAKKLGAKNTIARVRNPEYLKSVRYMKDNLGLDMSINPEYLTAKEMNRSLKYSNNVKISFLSKGKVELLEFKLKKDNPLIGIYLKDIKTIIKSKFIVVAVVHNDKIIVPNGEYIFHENDKILITATPNNITNIFKKMNANYIKIKDVMIVGGSKIAYYLTKNLLEDNINVKIIENDINKCNELNDKLNKAMIINADGSDKFMLTEEGIENTDAFIATTNMDEENVVLSIFANSFNVPKIITKINHLNFGEVLESIGIENVVTPHVIASNHILRYIRAKENSIGGNMESLIKLMDDELEIMDFKINSDFKYIGKNLKNIKFKKNIIVVCIKRKGEIIFPTGDDVIETNDNIIIATTNPSTKGLSDILR